MSSPLLDIKGIAAKLNSKVSTAYVIVQSNDFPAFKVGREWRAPENEVELWIQRQIKEKRDTKR